MNLKSLPQLGHLPLEVDGSDNLSQSISTLQTGHFSLLTCTSVMMSLII